MYYILRIQNLTGFIFNYSVQLIKRISDLMEVVIYMLKLLNRIQTNVMLQARSIGLWRMYTKRLGAIFFLYFSKEDQAPCPQMLFYMSPLKVVNFPIHFTLL